MNRRTLIASMPMIGAAAIIPAQAAQVPVFDLQHWLDTARVEDVTQYHVTMLVMAMHKRHGGLWRASLIDHGQHPPTALINCSDANGDGVWINLSGEAFHAA